MLATPFRALKEMCRVANPDGIVTCRESAFVICYHDSERLERDKQVMEQISLATGGYPHPGRYVHVWAEEAGLTMSDIRRSTGTWYFGSDEEREY